MDVMLLKQQFFTSSGANNRQEENFHYAFRLSHPLLQFLPQKLSEWIAKNLADELALPPKTGPGDDWSSVDLNSILMHCFVGRAITYTLLTLWSLNQTCIAALCALAATLSIWRTTAFMARISRYFNLFCVYTRILYTYVVCIWYISGIYLLCVWYIPVICQ